MRRPSEGRILIDDDSDADLMSWQRTALSITGAIAGAYLGATAAMAVSMARRPRRVALNDDPRSVGMEYRDISFPSRHRRDEEAGTLNGWLLPPEEGGHLIAPREARWVVIVHGDATNRADPQVGTLGLANDLNSMGYGVLMFDLRGCGESMDGSFTAGWDERLDVLAALDCLVELGADRSRIGVIGFSLGAVAADLACANPGTAAAVVSDSAFSDLWTMFKSNPRGGPMFTALMRPGLDFFLYRLYGYRTSDVSPATYLAESDTPTMIIHGELDQKVPPYHARILARACGMAQDEIDSGDTENFWLIPDAEHVQAYRTAPERYVERVDAFFNRHMAA